MADESNTSIATDALVVEPVAPVKKQRAPRVKKAEAKATATAAEPVKKNRGGRPKRAEATAGPATASATTARGKQTSASSPSAGKRRGPNRTTKPTVTASPLSDALYDLLQLEEENQRLRKSLAEKLRSENADLRSRLGLK